MYPGAKAPAVRDVSLEVSDGEIVTLLGPSGCGKTTMLRMVAGLETPDSGIIRFGERTVNDASRGLMIPPDKRDIGMVFQSYAVWPHMTVGENVAFPLRARGKSRREIGERVSKALELVGLTGMEKRPAPNLSGGQQQRVALARALVFEPRILLLDEPFSNLDAKLREQMRFELKNLQRRLNIALLFVTHDQIEALSVSQRIAIMNRGIIEQVGRPRVLYEEPKNEFVRDFIGSTLLFEGELLSSGESASVAVRICGGKDCLVDGRLIDSRGVGTKVYVAARPEDIQILPALDSDQPPGTIAGVVKTRLWLGERFEYQVDIKDQGEKILSGDRHAPMQDNQNVWLQFRRFGYTVWASNKTESEVGL
jgi:ABC-type Fe3+/spermidine/putrescine transport system ATPase subunit